MNAFNNYLNNLVNINRDTYSKLGSIKWLNPYQADEFESIKTKLLEPFLNTALFKHTKPFLNDISKGCELCGQGKWSCLFITGKCNAKCFYCPTDQSEDCVPTSQSMTFETPQAYAEYINHFGFKGVGFSGGEPLTVLTRVLDYLKELRAECCPDLYIWMYTNGILATEDTFKNLADAGLNEIRFDIGATNYNLNAINCVKGNIKNITIEIPSVPEEEERTKEMLKEFVDAGVTRLNLHQMRLTPYNAPQLLKRDYTYIHAERPIVLESELSALRIMNYALEENIPISINYCSFFFKSRFQKAGFRKIIAEKMYPSTSEITEQGFIREQTTDLLSYKRILITDENSVENSNQLKLKHKTYDTNEITDFSVNNSEVDISEIQNQTYPESQQELEIWKREFIEHSIRSY